MFGNTRAKSAALGSLGPFTQPRTFLGPLSLANTARSPSCALSGMQSCGGEVQIQHTDEVRRTSNL